MVICPGNARLNVHHLPKFNHVSRAALPSAPMLVINLSKPYLPLIMILFPSDSFAAFPSHIAQLSPIPLTEDSSSTNSTFVEKTPGKRLDRPDGRPSKKADRPHDEHALQPNNSSKSTATDAPGLSSDDLNFTYNEKTRVRLNYSLCFAC